MGLLDDARQFFTREAGQERRKWLDENLQEAGGLLNYYLGPTGVPDKLQAAGGLLNYTDAGDMTEAADASREFWNDPSFRGGVRLGTAGAAMAIPFVGARMLNDGVDVVGDALRSGGDDVGRFASDESGAVPTGRVNVKDLLRSEDGQANAAKSFSQGGFTPSDAPVKISVTPGGEKYLVDGYHRAEWAAREGDGTVPVEYVDFDKIKILFDNERSFLPALSPAQQQAQDVLGLLQSGWPAAK